jgi:hypothetical protein
MPTKAVRTIRMRIVKCKTTNPTRITRVRSTQEMI